MFDTPIYENHIFTLIKLLAKCYCKIRLHQLGKLESAKVSGVNVRKTLSFVQKSMKVTTNLNLDHSFDDYLCMMFCYTFCISYLRVSIFVFFVTQIFFVCSPLFTL